MFCWQRLAHIIIFGIKREIMWKLTITLVAIVILSALACSDRTNDKPVKVLTLNVRYDNPSDSLNAWPNRIKLVCDFLSEVEPDLLGFQEVLWHQFVTLDSALSDYSSAGAGRDDGAKGGEMNPVFYRKSKFDLVRSITFWLSETPEIPGSKGWGASLPRIVTWVELVEKKSQNRLFFFNTHFAHDSDSARLMSSKILLSKVAEIAGEFPFVITGDLNMLPSSAGYALLTGPAESVPLMKDSWVISEKVPSGPSYTYNGFSDRPGEGRIDFIFVRDGMRVSGHKTHDRKERGVFISDHWPVEATVLIK
jgi:endonuclease/exonuclease/phosphatase family metal-dependent hydrolase